MCQNIKLFTPKKQRVGELTAPLFRDIPIYIYDNIYHDIFNILERTHISLSLLLYLHTYIFGDSGFTSTHILQNLIVLMN